MPRLACKARPLCPPSVRPVVQVDTLLNWPRAGQRNVGLGGKLRLSDSPSVNYLDARRRECRPLRGGRAHADGRQQSIARRGQFDKLFSRSTLVELVEDTPENHPQADIALRQAASSKVSLCGRQQPFFTSLRTCHF